jgi:hypothetical protein
MHYSSRFWLYAPFLVVLILAGWVVFHWWQATSAFEKKLASIKGKPVMPGITLNWTSVRMAGFPFRVDAAFTGFQVKGVAAHGPFAWEAEKFALHALTYGRDKTVYEAAGRQRLGWTGADGARHAIQFQAGSIHGSSITGADGLVRFDLDLVNAGNKQFTARRFGFHLQREGDTLKLMVRADAVNGFGKPRKLVQAYASLSKTGLATPFLRGEMPWPLAMSLWRGLGGEATLSQIVEPELAMQVLTPLY